MLLEELSTGLAQREGRNGVRRFEAIIYTAILCFVFIGVTRGFALPDLRVDSVSAPSSVNVVKDSRSRL